MPEERSHVLVTGATGLAGSHTVRALLDAGHRVRALVRNPDKAERVFKGQEGPLENVRGDIEDHWGCGPVAPRGWVPRSKMMTPETPQR
jgi:nucleoside-diphosphate-sugar epimerase